MEIRLNSHPVFKGKILSVAVDEVINEEGHLAVREVVGRADTVAVLALDQEGMVLLVRQFRYAVGLDSLEIPAGSVDKGETPEDAALRELREETGFSARLIKPMFSYHPAIGYSQEKLTIFLAKDLTYSPLKGDEHNLRLEKVHIEELRTKVLGGNSPFYDGKSNLAVLLFKK